MHLFVPSIVKLSLYYYSLYYKVKQVESYKLKRKQKTKLILTEFINEFGNYFPPSSSFTFTPSHPDHAFIHFISNFDKMFNVSQFSYFLHLGVVVNDRLGY